MIGCDRGNGAGRRPLFLVYVSILLVALSAPAMVRGQGIFGGDADDVKVDVVDKNEQYRVGFLTFEAEGLSAELEYLQVSLPRIFIQEFEQIDEHFINAEELEQYRLYLRQLEIDTAAQQLNMLLSTEDQRLFSNTTTNTTAAQQRQQEKQIADAKTKVAKFMAYDISNIVVEQEKPLEVVNLTTEYSTARRPSYMRIAQQHNIDLLFDGLVVQDNEFILITIYYYFRAEGTVYELNPVSVGQDEIDLIPTLVNDLLADLVIGREWSSLVISGVGEHDSIYLDDNIIGYGAQTVRYIPLGTYDVQVESENFDGNLIQSVELNDRNPVEVEFVVDIPDLGYIDIITDPTAAIVYLNSTWRGETPLQVERTQTERALLIRKPGFFDIRRSLNSESEAQLQYTLVPELFDQGSWLLSRRDQFYASLTAFILSVPVPIILFGVADNSTAYKGTQDYLRLSAAERGAVTTTESLTQAGGYVGLFVSVTLAINTIIEAVSYVGAADFFHRL